MKHAKKKIMNNSLKANVKKELIGILEKHLKKITNNSDTLWKDFQEFLSDEDVNDSFNELMDKFAAYVIKKAND